MARKLDYKLYHEDGSEEDVRIPAKWIICGGCDGDCKTYLGWPAKDQPALTQEDFDQEGPEFLEDYMNGVYDKDCPDCKGTGKVLVVNRELFRRQQPEAYAKWLKAEKELQECRQIEESERRMGA